MSLRLRVVELLLALTLSAIETLAIKDQIDWTVSDIPPHVLQFTNPYPLPALRLTAREELFATVFAHERHMAAKPFL
jgi:hypothetical protein